MSEMVFFSQLTVSGDLDMIVVSFFPLLILKMLPLEKFWSAIMSNAFCSFTAFLISVNAYNILSLSIFILLSTSVAEGFPIAASLPRSVLRLLISSRSVISGMQDSCKGTTCALLLPHKMIKKEEFKCLPSAQICAEDGV